MTNTEAYQDMLTDLEVGEAYVIEDKPFHGYQVNKIPGQFNDLNKAVRAIAADMNKNKFWPNVYLVNDHGNVTLLSLRIGRQLGDFTPVTYKFLQSWV